MCPVQGLYLLLHFLFTLPPDLLMYCLLSSRQIQPVCELTLCHHTNNRVCFTQLKDSPILAAGLQTAWLSNFPQIETTGQPAERGEGGKNWAVVGGFQGTTSSQHTSNSLALVFSVQSSSV
jgi:hypothetical protein